MISTSLPPLSLYVHIPWCVKKCLYCDFNSHPLRSDVSPENYTESIIKDLMQYRHTLQDREIQTVFFGGGTPSVFEPALIGRIIDYVKDNFSIKDSRSLSELKIRHIIPIEDAFQNLETLVLNSNELKFFSNGRELINRTELTNIYKIIDKNNTFIGIGEINNKCLKHKQLV